MLVIPEMDEQVRFPKEEDCNQIVELFLPVPEIAEIVSDFVDMRFLHGDVSGLDDDLADWSSHKDRDVGWITRRMTAFGHLVERQQVIEHAFSQSNYADWCSALVKVWPEVGVLLATLAIGCPKYLNISKWCRSRFPNMKFEDIPCILLLKGSLWNLTQDRESYPDKSPEYLDSILETWEHMFRDWGLNVYRHLLSFKHCHKDITSDRWAILPGVMVGEIASHMFPKKRTHKILSLMMGKECEVVNRQLCDLFHRGAPSVVDWMSNVIKTADPKWLRLLRQYNQHISFLTDSNCLANCEESKTKVMVAYDQKNRGKGKTSSEGFCPPKPHVPILEWLERFEGAMMDNKLEQLVMWLCDAPESVRRSGLCFVGLEASVPIIKSLMSCSSSFSISSSSSSSSSSFSNSSSSSSSSFSNSSSSSASSFSNSSSSMIGPTYIPMFLTHSIENWCEWKETRVSDADLHLLLTVYGERLISAMFDYQDTVPSLWSRLFKVGLEKGIIETKDVPDRAWYALQSRLFLEDNHACQVIDRLLLKGGKDIFSFGSRETWQEVWKYRHINVFPRFQASLLHRFVRNGHFNSSNTTGFADPHFCSNIHFFYFERDHVEAFVGAGIWPSFDQPLSQARFLLKWLEETIPEPTYSDKSYSRMKSALRIACHFWGLWRYDHKQQVSEIWKLRLSGATMEVLRLLHPDIMHMLTLCHL